MAEIKEQFIQVKTKANFVTKLTNGEIKDSSIAFIEDSSEIWAKGKYYPCPYTKESLDNKFNEYISLLQKGQANGVATLDANGKVPVTQMPTTKTINGASIFGSGNLQLSASLYKIVDTLPTTDIDTSKIYLVPASATTAKNNKTEYIYLGDPNKAYDESKWEKLGDEQKSSTVTTPGGSITVDTALIEDSPNPVAGGVVKAKIDEIDTKLANWQGVDDEPTIGSNNLVKSGGVEKRLYDIDGLSTYVDKKTINNTGVISDNNSFFISTKIPIKSKDTIFWKYSNSAVRIFFCVFDQNDNVLSAWNGINGSKGERTFTINVAASYAIASFDRNSDYTPLVKVNGETVWTKREKGAIELIKEKIVTDNFPSFGSNNLVKSNGIFIDCIYTKVNIDNVDIKEAINNSKHNGYVDKLGTVKASNATWFYSDPILLKAGYIITTVLKENSSSALSIAQRDSVNVGDILTPINSKTYKATEDVYIVISGMVSELNRPIYIKKGKVRTPIALIEQIDKDFYGIGNTVCNKYINYDGTIHDDNDWNIISIEVNQNDSVTWVVGALRGDASLVIYDINDNILGYYNVKGAPSNKDSRDIKFSNYPNAHHIVASFSKFLLNGDENTVPLEINGIGIESIDRTSKGTYDTVKELNKRVSEICQEPYENYGIIGINYPSEVKKVIEDIDKNISGTKLHFCHVSDNHGGRFGYANEFTDLSPAKFLVNTGDLVTDKFSDSFDTPKGLILAMDKPGYVVLGNHDVYNSTSLQERFEKYFAPLNEHNGLTGNTKTYYFVDYPQEKVKCIFLDMNDGWDDTSGLSMSYFINMSKMSSEQINWFAQELIDAKTNNLHVACFIHVSPDYVNYEKSPIDFYDYQVEKATNVAFLCDMIDKFIEGGTVTFTHNEQEYTFSFVAGGHFVGWFCGHMHSDTSGWMLNHPKQFSISVPRPGWNSMEEDGTYRIPKLGIAFNYVTIDTKFQRLSILRIGNNKTIWGTSREEFSIRYNLKTLENKTIDVDAELKDSPNPVQNRAVKKAVDDLNTEIGKKADTAELNSAVGRITALENNGATGVTVTESGEGNGIASIKNVGKNIVATKATFVTSLTGLATTAALNDGLAGKADVNHNHDTKYAAKEHTHPEYAQSSALNDYVTKTALDGKNFLTATSLNGYVNEVQPDGTSGNGIANITKEGKVLKVTKATFLTEHQSLADYATQAWVRQNAATQEWVKNQNYLTANDLQETIKITLVSTKSTSDAALRGAKITVKNGSSTIGTYTWQGSVISLKVASGLEVTVSVSDVTGYKTPAEQKFMTAISNIREVKMEYKEQKLGIFILETDGTMTDPTNWTKSDNSTILGIYVGGENCAFVMALEGKLLPWSAKLNNTVVPGVKSEDGSEVPTTDYDGIGNTKKFIAASPNDTERSSAAYYCNNYQFKNGKNGYLFALGEALVVHKNFPKITQAYNAIRCSDIAVSLQNGYWTSNQSARSSAWYCDAGQDATRGVRAEQYFVIPVCQY